MFFVARLGWAGLVHTNGLSVNRTDNAIPACQCFLQAKLDCSDKVITDALEGRVVDLSEDVSNDSSSVIS